MRGPASPRQVLPTFVVKSGYVQLALNGEFRVQLTSKKVDFSGEFQGGSP